MQTAPKLDSSKPLLSRLHWLPRFMDRVMVGACMAGGGAIGYMVWRMVG